MLEAVLGPGLPEGRLLQVPGAKELELEGGEQGLEGGRKELAGKEQGLEGGEKELEGGQLVPEGERQVPEGGGRVPVGEKQLPEDAGQELEDGVFQGFRRTWEGSYKSGQVPSTLRTAGPAVWGAALRGTREESSFLE